MDLEIFLANCQTQMGYAFRNKELLRNALTHSSGADTPLAANERMEFLGDSVLSYVICDYLFKKLPNTLEGDMTKVKSSVVSRSTCQKNCKKLGLDKFLILGRGLGRSNRIPDSIFANTLEAFIAAVYLDGGMEEARKFVIRVFREDIEEMLQDSDAHNHKSVLQQHCQKFERHIPEYKVLEIKGPEHRKTFHVQVRVGTKFFPSAWGITKNEAEQRAAENALAALHDLPVPYWQ
jgi:ribonuclease-3